MPLLTSLGSAVVKGGRLITSPGGRAVIGLGAAGIGAGIATQAFLRTPEAVSKSKYLGDMMFPSDLVVPSANRNAYISIRFQEYQRRSIFNQPFLNATGGIRLPIPSNLTDNQQVQYDSSKQSDATTGAAIEAGISGRNGAGASGSMFGSIGSAVTGALGGAAVTGAAALGTAAGIDVAQALQLGGLAQNPFLTVLFQSPAFKKHSFSWKLAPNNAQESNNLRDIINAFKSNMLPAMAPNAGGTLLTYPNMAIISLYPDESYLYKFKPCVVESLNVNYAAGGQPSFFKGTNAPTHVQIDVNFLEIEYWLKEDMENNELRSKGGFF